MEMMPPTENDPAYDNLTSESTDEVQEDSGNASCNESPDKLKSPVKVQKSFLSKDGNVTFAKNVIVSNGFPKLGRKSRMSSDGRGGYVNVETSLQETYAISSTSDDDFEDVPLKSPGDELVIFQQPLSPKYNKGPAECRKQLLKDGYRFDEQSDEEDLDLVMPMGRNVTWCSCERYCVIQ